MKTSVMKYMYYFSNFKSHDYTNVCDETKQDIKW